MADGLGIRSMCPSESGQCVRVNQDNVSEWRSDMRPMDLESGQCVRVEERHAADGLGIRTMCPSGGATCVSQTCFGDPTL